MGCDASSEPPTTQPHDTKLTPSQGKPTPKTNLKHEHKDSKQASPSRTTSEYKINSSKSMPKHPNSKGESKGKLLTSRTGTSTGDDGSMGEEKSLRGSTRSLNKSGRHLEVNPSKVKLAVREIPEEEVEGTARKVKKSKKEGKKLEEFMKIYGL